MPRPRLGFPTFSTRRDNLRRPLIRSAGRVPGYRSGWAQSRPSSAPTPAENGCPARVDPGPANSGRPPGCLPPESKPSARAARAAIAGHGLDRTARPLAAMPHNSGSTAVRTSGVFSSVRATSGTKPASWIISARADARQDSATTTDSRAPQPTSTIWPGPASTPERSATAGGTDSAAKKESWLTSPTVSQRAGRWL